MELTLGDLDSWNGLLQTKTGDIDLEILRSIIRTCHQIEYRSKSNEPISQNKLDTDKIIYESSLRVSDMLMVHLKNGFTTLEAQSLCSTSLFALFTILPQQFCEISLKDIQTILTSHLQELDGYDNCLKRTKNSNIVRKDSNLYIISLITGLFQTNVLNRAAPQDASLQYLSDDMIIVSFKIMAKACLTYSSYTFISFRNLQSIIKKIFEWEKENIVLNDHQYVLLFVISNNWENTITGVREINSKLWTLYLQLITRNKSTPELFDKLLTTIMRFPWNKAKFFILCEIIPYFKSDVIDFLRSYPSCVNGLEYSLRNPSLVSAGSDMYKAILQTLKSFSDWTDIFLDLFTKVLNEKSFIIQTYILNHWWPATVKKFPNAFNFILDSYFNRKIKENDYYSILSILKFGRKGGLILTDWDESVSDQSHIKRVINFGLNHINEEIRTQAFQVICSTQKNNIPTKDEFDIFRHFLTDNINHDSTSFRQNNLNCFTLFLIRLRDTFLIMLRNKHPKKAQLYEEHFVGIENFFSWMYDFLTTNLKGSGNYQRKILSLQMYDVIMRYLCGGYNDKENIKRSLCRKGNQRDQGWMVVAFLESRQKWKFNSEDSIRVLIKCIDDPTNDIRETAVNILIQYHKNNPYLLKCKREFFVTGIVLCNSRMFYETESGCLMFKILANLTKNTSGEEDSVESLIAPCADLPEYFMQKAWEQFIHQESDLLFSIYNNQPLHGMLSAVDSFIKYSKHVPAPNFIDKIIKLLTTINNHFLNTLACKSKSSVKEFPPSFAEMGESIEHVILSSPFKPDESLQESGQLLSNAHQLVLNNIWLNLKACCELSSTVLTRYSDHLAEKQIKECLDICISVLTRCRHKGAIESSGVALGRSVKHLTTLNNAGCVKVISDILEDFLVQATCEDVHGGSITRKSAGLTILVHRIVSNDSQDGKPLFHLAMNLLLKVLSSPVPLKDSKHTADLKTAKRSENETPANEDIANERDVPLARALHLLCRTVCESSLASYVIQFASQLATVCFSHLTSEQWQIRNAALQLYGALVPKLIGQKKSQGEDTCAESPTSADELFAHIPSLWHHIHESLRSCCDSSGSANILLAHSNLVPILSLLSSMSKRCLLNNFCLKECQSMSIHVIDVEDLFPFLSTLLGSPIYTVRNISAKIIESFYDLELFYQHWTVRKGSHISENELHGYLLAVKYYVTYFKTSKYYLFNESEIGNRLIIFDKILDDTDALIANKNSSFIVKTLQFDLLYKDRDEFDYLLSVTESIELLESADGVLHSQIGFHQWMYLQITFSVLNCNESDLLIITQKCVAKDNFSLVDYFLPALKRRLTNRIPEDRSVMQSIFEIVTDLCSKENRYLRKDILKILHILACNMPATNTQDLYDKAFDVLYSVMSMKDDVYNYGYLLPLLCLMKSNKCVLDDDDCVRILELSKICKRLSKPDNCDAEHRFISAVSVRYLVKILHYFCINKMTAPPIFDIKSNTLMAALRLLQDEDSNVRNQCSKVYFLQDGKASSYPYPNIQVKNILNRKFLVKMFDQSDQAIDFLKSFLDEISQNVNNEKASESDLQNPFDHNITNIYWESQLIEKHILHLLKKIAKV